MAIRYSGDTEVRLRYDRGTGFYQGSVTDPYLRWHGRIRIRPGDRRIVSTDPTDSTAYDGAARALIDAAEKWAARYRKSFALKRKGPKNTVHIRRVFQAPCPLARWGSA